jgi:hypothetical protein
LTPQEKVISKLSGAGIWPNLLATDKYVLLEVNKKEVLGLDYEGLSISFNKRLNYQVLAFAELFLGIMLLGFALVAGIPTFSEAPMLWIIFIGFGILFIYYSVTNGFLNGGQYRLGHPILYKTRFRKGIPINRLKFKNEQIEKFIEDVKGNMVQKQSINGL